MLREREVKGWCRRGSFISERPQQLKGEPDEVGDCSLLVLQPFQNFLLRRDVSPMKCTQPLLHSSVHF